MTATLAHACARVVCEQTFIKTTNQKYCSAECREADKADRKRVPDKVCVRPDCSNTVVRTGGPAQLYCSPECTKIMSDEADRRSTRVFRQKHPDVAGIAAWAAKQAGWAAELVRRDTERAAKQAELDVKQAKRIAERAENEADQLREEQTADAETGRHIELWGAWGMWLKSSRLRVELSRPDLMMALHDRGVDVSCSQIVGWEKCLKLPHDPLFEQLVHPLSDILDINPSEIRRIFEATAQLVSRIHEQCTDEQAVVAAFQYEPKFSPDVPYPGFSNMKWAGHCLICGKPVVPTLNDMQRGQGCCLPCGHIATAAVQRHEHDDAVALAFGWDPTYSPKTLYPGNNHMPWLGDCLGCGEEVQPTLGSLSQGQGCCKGICRSIKIKRAALTRARAAGKYVGVYFDKKAKSKPYEVRLYIDGQQVIVDRYETVLLAVHARDDYARKHTNWPESLMNFPIPRVG